MVLDPEHVGEKVEHLRRTIGPSGRPPGMSDPGTVVVGCHWHDRSGELSYVARAVAGAASRCGPVAVLVPGRVGRAPTGRGVRPRGHRRGRRPAVAAAPRPRPAGGGRRAERAGRDDARRQYATTRRLHPVGGRRGTTSRSPAVCASCPKPDAVGEPSVEVHVAVNRLAQRHRHHGFGFTGYQLVLSDRSGRHDDPPPAAAWIGGAFDDDDVVVVEDAVAWAWKGRVLRGMVPVDTRMDLWRLVAHANVCVDLAPGRQIARECVEALRFGTPIVVPADAGTRRRARRSRGRGELRRPGRARVRRGAPARPGQPVHRLRSRGDATPTRTTAIPPGPSPDLRQLLATT